MPKEAFGAGQLGRSMCLDFSNEVIQSVGTVESNLIRIPYPL